MICNDIKMLILTETVYQNWKKSGSVEIALKMLVVLKFLRKLRITSKKFVDIAQVFADKYYWSLMKNITAMKEHCDVLTENGSVFSKSVHLNMYFFRNYLHCIMHPSSTNEQLEKYASTLRNSHLLM